MKQLSNFDPEFTILMPCLNERRTLPLCIREIQTFLSDADISAEIQRLELAISDRTFPQPSPNLNIWTVEPSIK